MTFGDWWKLHRNGECNCRDKQQCVFRIFQQQESWVDEKAKKRLLQFLKIAESDEYNA